MVVKPTRRHGRSQSHEVHWVGAAAKTRIVSCEKCKYAANPGQPGLEVAAVEDSRRRRWHHRFEVHTPG
jgi:hypothetical protein